MSVLRKAEIHSHDDWITARMKGIGASEAASIVGRSPWMTAQELWQIKTGMKERKDLSGNPLVEQGHRMEYAIRELYSAYHPDYTVLYNQYYLLYQEDRPWLFATLDGEVVDKHGRKGILECKTSTPQGKSDWDKWNMQIPDQYMIQILHQFLATGYEFADLMALLINIEEDFVVRTYHFERKDYEQDLEWLLTKEEEFWKSVQNKTLPSMTIVL